MRLGSRLLNVVVFGSALAILAAGGAKGDEGAAEGVMAQPLEREDPQYPQSQADKGREGWVEFSYVIAPDGTTQDILIADSVGSAEFEKPTLEAVERWRFKPATLAEKPVQQCHNWVRMLFVLDPGKKGKRKASSDFIARFEAATKLASESDFEGLKSAIDNLAPRNLYEYTYASFLSAIVAQHEYDPDAQLMHLRRATSGGAEYIQPDLYVSALETAFVLKAKRGEYASALMTYQKLVDSKKKSKALRDLAKEAEKIEALIAGDARLSRVGELGPQREGAEGPVAWGHRLSRRIAGLDEIDGELDHIELRCDFHRVIAEPIAERALRMPEDWGTCFFYVFGEPGAQFRVIEYADSEFAD
jgi:TonB family protein